MTARLREVLHEAATDVPTYPVYERALATARRSRRRAVVAAVAALVLVALVAAVPPLVRTPAVDPAVGADAALPDRVALPPLGTLHATDRPRLGPASVIFTGQAPRLAGWDEDGVVAVVSADSDHYRIFSMGYEAPAGEQVVLSPDGRYIARPAGSSEKPRIDIIDLVAGDRRHLASKVSGSVSTQPLGWSPDGERLLVRDTKPVDFNGATYSSVLSIVSLDGERWTRLAGGAQEAHLGSAVAFAPDRRRLAYQYGRTIAVTDLDGREISSFRLPDETWLAGKGAWTADGRALALVTRRSGSTEWSLRRVDPGTGGDAGPLRLPGVSGVTALRLLGWGPDGSALVVAFQPEPLSPTRFDQPLEMDQRTAYGNVRSVRLLALAPGAAPRTMMTAPEQVLALDVADDVIRSGRTRDARPPGGVGGRFWFWTILTCLVVTGFVAYCGRGWLAERIADRRLRLARGRDG